MDVIIRNTQGAESLVKGYEVKLSQEEAVPVDLATIRSHRAALKVSGLEAELLHSRLTCTLGLTGRVLSTC